MDATRAALGQLEDQAATWSSGKISLAVMAGLSKQLKSSESLYSDIAYYEDVMTGYELAINSLLLLVSCSDLL